MTKEEIIRRLENISRSIVPKNKEFIEDSKAIMLAIEAVKAAGRFEIVTVQKIGSTKKDRILKDNDTCGYYGQYVTQEALEKVFGWIEVEE